MISFDTTGVTSLDVPVVELLGRHDWTTPNEPTVRWFEQLSAPQKTGIWFERSGHMCMFEEPGKFLVSLVDHVLPLCGPPPVSSN